MAFNHRKMLVSYPPEYSFNLTIYIPFFQKYPPPPPPPPHEEDLSLLVSTLICVIGSVLLFLFLFVFLYLYITQPWRSSSAAVAPSTRREDEDEAEESDFSGDHHVWRITTRGLHRSTINSITVVRFKKGEGLIDGTECFVCLSEFEQDQSLRLLPKCSHAFHINCIDTWLLSHKNCPLCRAPVILTQPPPRNHASDPRVPNELSGGEEQESSRSRNLSVLPRAHSDLANHCGSGSVETVRRSFSVGGSSSLKASDGTGSNDIANTSRRHFYSSFSANFFSSSRRSRNQDPVLPIRIPSTSD